MLILFSKLTDSRPTPTSDQVAMSPGNLRTLLSLVAVAFSLAWLGTVAPAMATQEPQSDEKSETASTDEAGVGIESAFPKLRFIRPIHLTHLNDNRIFVVEQGGRVHVFENRPDADQTKIFLDIRDRVCRVSNEEGLLGFAFHPDFKTNGEFFVHYSSSVKDMTSTVARYRVDLAKPDVGLPDSEEIILEVKQPFRNHNGGAIAFGKDGMLYISLGDGGKANDPLRSGQDLNSLLGKILRIDVNQTEAGKAYAIPKDNPFVDQPNARPEIYALGLRNVWRFSIDRKTGDIWAGDVGQNRFDEISRIVKGGNYGWNRWEAEEPFDTETKMATEPHQTPVAFIGREWGLSVTGGNVYRGKRFPELDGSYFYGDYITGNLWQMTRNKDGKYESKLVRRAGRSIAAFGEDADGEVFLLSFDGYIYRIIPTAEPENFLADWPQTLSESGIFASVEKKRMSDEYIAYEVNAPFWSDGAQKTRYVRLPEGKSMTYRDVESWQVPVGTEIVKNFKDEYGWGRMLETRVIRRTAGGWESATYVWDKKGTEANLYPQGRHVELWGTNKKYKGLAPNVRIWHGPSSSECASCHTDASGYVLGLRTPQLNKGMGQENQIIRMAKRGLVEGLPENFDPSTASRFCNPQNEQIEIETRARVTLDVNCAMCHRPNGPGNAKIDLRHDVAREAMGMIDVPPAQSDLGIKNAKLLAPGSPSTSVVLKRMATLNAGRMPTIGSNQIDHQSVAIIKQWIEGMKPQPKPQP